MKITCRTGDDRLTIRTFRSNDASYSASENTDWIHKDQTVSYDHKADTIKIAIYQEMLSAGDPVFFFGRGGKFPSMDVVGDFNWDKEILLVKGNANRYSSVGINADLLNQYGGVNWTDILSKYQKTANDQSKAASAIDTAGQVGQALLNGLATGLGGSNVPVLGAAGGFISFVGQIFIQIFDSQTPPPEPPDISQITDAVKSVVQEQLALEDAAKAANTFQAAANFCIKWWREADRALKAGRDFIKRDKDLLDSELRNWLSDLNIFQDRLSYLKSHPEVARYVLPSFITGLGADLQLRRTDLMIRKLGGHEIVASDVAEIRQSAASASTALTNARDSFKDYVQAKITGDLGTTTIDFPEKIQLRKMVIKSYTGNENLDFVDRAIKRVERVERLLEEDENLLKQNKPPINIWKRNWQVQPQPV